jgi:hypothetical protein
VDNDLQTYKNTSNTTFMKKIAESNLDLGNTHRIKNVPDTVNDRDAISKQESNQRYRSITSTLDEIPDPVADIDLNGYKIRNSGAILIGDMGVPGQGTTLTTIDWVEGRGGVFRDEAKAYAD